MELTSGVIFALISLVKKILNFFTDWKRQKHETEKHEAMEEAKAEVQEATSSGTLADLINAANKIGEAKKL